VYLAVLCRITNEIFARIYETPANAESSYITALILTLLITPEASWHQVPFITVAGGLAIASKYVLALHKKHFFNPVAISLVLLYFAAGDSASWWVGNTWLTPIVVGGGLLIARKIQRMQMVLVFFMAAIVSTIMVSKFGPSHSLGNVIALIRHSSIFFLGFIMLTEPLTSPPTDSKRYAYAVLVGILFPPQIHVARVYFTPELALVFGNVFSYIVSAKVKMVGLMEDKLRLAPDIWSYRFKRIPNFGYRAGQYVELTYGYGRTDERGNRRMFTLASSPTEPILEFGVKFYPRGSSFKRALQNASNGTRFAISAPAGQFTLPKDSNQKLAFIAGGIGITPFRSMIKYLLDTGEHRDITLIYAERTSTDFVYTDVFRKAAAHLNSRVIYTISQAEPGWYGYTGRVNKVLLATEIPDYRERLFYISGSLPLVSAVKDELRKLGVPYTHIKTDYFSGYA